ncbi:unnamed protein product [Phytophthora lilii]|uniref:Unnamed protein product n=1 Tax=Phytophthora lilii TaxID=2077276 RepID=A0A9W6WX41_9STRA|nr:unnamed protein product [Phytophthora lilii]
MALNQPPVVPAGRHRRQDGLYARNHKSKMTFLMRFVNINARFDEEQARSDVVDDIKCKLKPADTSFRSNDGVGFD